MLRIAPWQDQIFEMVRFVAKFAPSSELSLQVLATAREFGDTLTLSRISVKAAWQIVMEPCEDSANVPVLRAAASKLHAKASEGTSPSSPL